MQKKQIEIDCPCCSTRLTVDVLTQTVMRAVSPQELDESGEPLVPNQRWESARDRVDSRSAGAGDRLDEALNAEKNKANRLDDLFDQAKEKLKRKEEERDEFDS